MRLAVILLASIPALAQPVRPEIYGQVGVLRLAGDEGSLGSGVAYGGAVVLPFHRRWALDIDVITARATEDRPAPDLFTERRTLVLPSVIARWGNERIYGYAGGGAGLQSESSRVRGRIFTSPTDPGSVFERESTVHGVTLHGKTGFVYSPAPHLVLRADLTLAWRYVLPSVGFKLGLGYRF